MEMLGSVLVIGGMVLSVIGSIWLLVVIFSESVLWGLGCLFVPFVSLIFLLCHWDVSAKPFGLSVLGMLLTLGGAFLAPGEMSWFLN